jgi:hypothetical protein
MTTDITTDSQRVWADIPTEAEGIVAKAAMKRIKLILDTTPYLLDDRSMIRCINDEHDDAQSFIRDYLDVPGTNEEILTGHEYKALTTELATSILNDLRLIWNYPYYRDDISHIAMKLSLCPLHFCDWASCFDDDDEECKAIRAIFPYGHDT